MRFNCPEERFSISYRRILSLPKLSTLNGWIRLLPTDFGERDRTTSFQQSTPILERVFYADVVDCTLAPYEIERTVGECKPTHISYDRGNLIGDIQFNDGSVQFIKERPMLIDGNDVCLSRFCQDEGLCACPTSDIKDSILFG